ncbi:class I SAM-dependent methyltransferase [Symbioplanes lichenis]|uniref:class I SAM-dependent methyltransferase n=1 Tax=Symbioplanes lichenis TaxID=1629072 RepID=UPI00273A131B|nr:class I SAM-dependent methyltransferase [Actinoplanes lichenis]
MEQRAIYDLRYCGDGYDARSAVRVLTAEAVALDRAVGRALSSLSGQGPVTLFDFGYGTGRVTNEFLVEFPRTFADAGRDLRVIAYDVSAQGLRKAARSLADDHGFHLGDLVFSDAAVEGYVAGSAGREDGGTRVSVTFVHGSEGEGSDAVQKLILRANDDVPVMVTTSWYSAIAHMPGAEVRASFFRMLSEVTDPRGELLVAPSVSGDLPELQEFWTKKRLAGEAGGLPIEMDGDVIYRTELEQDNYCHVFGPDLWELLEAVTQPGQHAWLEAIRLPDEEFRSRAEEQDNYRRLRAFNQEVGRRRWTADDYRRVHTAAAIRSGSPAAAGD